MKINIIKVLPVILLLLWAGCSKNDASTNATRLRVSITESPIFTESDFKSISELNIDIRKIEVFAVSSNSENSEEWVSLDYSGGEYNILPLSNGRLLQISDEYFPAGVLQKIRITLGDNSNFKTYEGNQSLILDSSYENENIFDLNTDLYAHYITNIVVDISATIYEQNGNYFYKPSLRVFPETYGGILRGYVTPVEANPQVIITNDTETLYSIPEAKDGLFVFKGLEKGKWDIHIISDPKLGYKDTIFSDTIFWRKTTELKSRIVLKKIEDENSGEGEDD